MHSRLIATALVASTLALSACANHSSSKSGEHVERMSDKTLLNPETDAPGLKVGDKAPDIVVLNANGASVDLGDLYKQGPVVVTFYRGGWCPFCVRALKDWSGRIDELNAAGGTFVAISPETREHAIETGEKVDGDWLVLVDTNGEAMRAFNTGFALDPATEDRYRGFGINLDDWNTSGEWELPAPATYVIDRDGVIRWAFADWDYKKRADPDLVIAEVRKLSGKTS